MKLLREPLLQFLLVGAALFAWFRVANPPADSSPDRIVISQGLLDHLGTNFSRTWQRLPSEDEMAGLIREHIRDEIAYREALAIGLDRDDAIVRRRMRQKLEFLSDEAGGSLTPTDDELDAYLAVNHERYAFDPEIAFSQVFFDPGRHDDVEEAIGRLLETLPVSPVAADDLAALGDSMMLPPAVPLSPLWQVRRHFGEVFADAILAVDPGQWSGPIRSGYGLHLVFVAERVEGRVPELGSTVARLCRRVLRGVLDDRPGLRHDAVVTEATAGFQGCLKKNGNI